MQCEQREPGAARETSSVSKSGCAEANFTIVPTTISAITAQYTAVTTSFGGRAAHSIAAVSTVATSSEALIRLRGGQNENADDSIANTANRMKPMTVGVRWRTSVRGRVISAESPRAPITRPISSTAWIPACVLNGSRA